MVRLSDYFEYKQDEDGNAYIEVSLHGLTLLRFSATNKGTAFPIEERIAFGLDGLLPPSVVGLDEQVKRIYHGFLRQTDDLQRYQFLRSSQERSEVAFYAVLEKHLEEMMPIIYTPTVGKAVQQYSNLYQAARGLTFSQDNIQRADDVVGNYPWHDVRMVVVTDASAILGIGDQGHGGLAICIGKLSLYTAGGGLSPYHTMPVSLDVGTDRKELLEDPGYLGMRHARLQGKEYFDLIDRFVEAVEKRWPKAVIQWEDFAKDVAFEILDRYQGRVPCFNDDIQGTGAMALAGLLTACRQQGRPLIEQRVVIAGAGAGGVGVANIIKQGMLREGLSPEQAMARVLVMDGRGLVMQRTVREGYKRSVAQPDSACEGWAITGEVPSLMDVVENFQPTVLLGLSGVPDLFNQPLVERMAQRCDRPIIFPLSNPTSSCEALPHDLYEWTQGRCIVATGSPFPEVEYAGERHVIAQGNNAFVFPGIGFAAVLGRCRYISEEMILESAYALADYTQRHCLEDEGVFPPVRNLREVSVTVSSRVLAVAQRQDAAERSKIPEGDIESYVRSRMWKPEYLPFRPAKQLL